MGDIRLIASDMDGTLLDDDHVRVPERNIMALRAAAAGGVPFAVASGRPWSLLTGVREQLGVIRYGILSNGAAVLDVETGEWLYRQGMAQEQRRALLRLLLEWDIPFEVYCEGENYIQAGRLERLLEYALSPEFRQVLRTCSRFPADLNAALDGRVVEKIHIFHVPPGERGALTARIEALGPVTISDSFGQNMELTAPGVNKGAALQALGERLGLSPGQVMAFGDAGNDLEMLRWAGYSFAMENASDLAKQAARFRTGTNRAGGVGMAVERYVLD